MLLLEAFRSNAYRTLRLSADATVDEVRKAAAGWKRSETLGRGGANCADLLQLGDVSRSESDLRAAVDRLTTPTLRLQDRLFWFHHLHRAAGLSGQARVHSAQRVIAMHDESLRAVIDSLQLDFDESGISARFQALRAWHHALCDDAYWEMTLAIDSRGGFEPVASASETKELRHEAVRIAADGLIVAGRDAVSRNDLVTASRIIAGLGNFVESGPWAVAAVDDLVSPLVADVRAKCRGIINQPEQVTREKEAETSRNRAICDNALRQFRESVSPALDRLNQLLPDGHPMVSRCREQAGLCLARIGGDYTWADAFIVAEGLLAEARSLAHDTRSAAQINYGLSRVRDSAHKERCFGQLEPVSEAPSLFTINGIGCTFYGQSDKDPETQSYATVHYFVVGFIPLFPLGRYRVIQSGGSRYRILGRLPLRIEDCWPLGITAAIVAVLLIMLIANSV